MNLKSQCGTKDHKYLAPRLISHFKGAMHDDARSIELSAADYLDLDGVEKLLASIWKMLNIRDLDLETEAFDKYFNNMMRRKGETLTKYINAEETAYRKLQRVLKEAMEGGQDEYSDDDWIISGQPTNQGVKQVPITETTSRLVIHGTVTNSIKRT